MLPGAGNANHAELALSGIFVQIGLMPSTKWLEGALERNPMGEIMIDGYHCRTSAAGVFAAGDRTNALYKQIIIAMGEAPRRRYRRSIT